MFAAAFDSFDRPSVFTGDDFCQLCSTIARNRGLDREIRSTLFRRRGGHMEEIIILVQAVSQFCGCGLPDGGRSQVDRFFFCSVFH